jgi:hypothetical protein
MFRQCTDQASGEAAPVRTAIESQVGPRIRVSLTAACGQVRRVRENEVESPKARREIGTNRLYREVLGAGALKDSPKRRRIEVGGDDPRRSVPC